MSDLQKENLSFWLMVLGIIGLLAVSIFAMAFDIMPIIYIIMIGCILVLLYLCAFGIWRAVYRWRIMGALESDEFCMYILWSDSICFGEFDEIRENTHSPERLAIIDKIEKVKRPNWLIFK